MTAEVLKYTREQVEALELAPGTENLQLEGWVPELAGEDDLRQALEKAFDYRGDITITRKDGSVVEGYVFDRRTGRTLAESLVRVIAVPPKGAAPGTATQRVSVPYADVAALKFTGRDTAAGKSFEAWVKKYWEKKAAGETNIQNVPETLD